LSPGAAPDRIAAFRAVSFRSNSSGGCSAAAASVFVIPSLLFSFRGFAMLRLSRSSGGNRTILQMSVLLTALLMSGCDQVESVVNDVKSEISSTPSAAPSPVPVSPVEQPAIVPTVPDPVVPPPPNPQEVAGRLLSMKPGEIDDTTLTQVANLPEAAAMITELTIAGSHVTGAGLSQLPKYPQLKSVNMAGMSHLASGDLSSLGNVKSLVDVNLRATQAEDNLLHGLATLPHLQSVQLDNTKVTSAGVAALKACPELQSLSLQGTAVTDEALIALADSPLRKLSVQDTGVTDAGVSALGRSTTLEELNIGGTRTSFQAFKTFKNPPLRFLNAGSTAFGVDGLVLIRNFKNLEELHLFQAGVIEQPKANVFRSLPKLRVLVLNNNLISDQGVDILLKGHKTLERLELGGMKSISDRGLAALVTNKALKYLNVHGTSCSSAGARALKERLPELKVYTEQGEF